MTLPIACDVGFFRFLASQLLPSRYYHVSPKRALITRLRILAYTGLAFALARLGSGLVRQWMNEAWPGPNKARMKPERSPDQAWIAQR